MPDDRPANRPPRARASADLPLERLLERAEELTRRWAIALIGARPMEGLGSVPLAELADDGPELCRAVLRALCSDEDLARAIGEDAPSDTGAGELPVAARLATMSGARDERALVEAAEALRGAAWELLLEEICGPLALSPRAVAEVADRLAHVCSRLLGEALAEVAPGEERARRSSVAAPGFPVRPVRSAQPTSRTALPGRVVILDERADSGAELDREPATGFEPGRGASYLGGESGPGLDMDTGAGTSEGPRLATVPTVLRDDIGALPSTELGAPEIEIRDERREEGPAAWIGSIGRQLERFGSDGRPFAVLLVEPLDLESTRGERMPQGETATLSRLERLLADELALAAGGWLTRERPGRYWLIAPETDRIAAARLCERLERAVGVPANDGAAGLGGHMAIAVGSAICPEDGERAPALAAHADVGLYAARAEFRAAASRPAGDGGEP